MQPLVIGLLNERCSRSCTMVRAGLTQLIEIVRIKTVSILGKVSLLECRKGREIKV